MESQKALKTQLLLTGNAIALAAGCYLLIKHGRIPTPVASPDELRFDLLAPLMAVLILPALVTNSIASAAIFMSRRDWSEKRFAAGVVSASLLSWIILTALTLRYTG